MMTCVHVLIHLFDCLEGSNSSRFKAANCIDRLGDILLSFCLAFLLCNTRYLFRPIPNPFEPRDILFIRRPLYIHALSNIVILPDAHALRSQREIIVFRYSGILLLAAPADIADWSILHSATLVPVTPGGDSKPFFMSFFFMSLCLLRRGRPKWSSKCTVWKELRASPYEPGQPSWLTVSEISPHHSFPL